MADSGNPPEPEAGTTVGQSDEKATCMKWYHKPSSEPENKGIHTQCMQAKDKQEHLSLFFFTSSFFASSHAVIIFSYGLSACRHSSSALHPHRIRKPVHARRTLLEHTSRAHSTLLCRLLFEIQLESFC
jgi:hypothetical protein